MRAKKISESLGFKRGENPYDKLDIGPLKHFQSEIPAVRPDTSWVNPVPYTYKNLAEYTNNELLAVGVAENHIGIIQYALNNGADQIWWQSGGTGGGWHGIKMGINDSFAVIKGVKSSKKGIKGRKTNDEDLTENRITITYSQISNIGTHTSTSNIFRKKYSPITPNFIKEVEEYKKKFDFNYNLIQSSNKITDGVFPKFHKFSDR